MKKMLRILLYLTGAFLILLAASVLFALGYFNYQASPNRALADKPSPILAAGGFTFRDLNKNGKLDVYEDSRQPVESRVTDLLSQMTLEEKAGMLFITMAGIGPEGSLFEKPSLLSPETFIMVPSSELILKKINHVNVMSAAAPDLARWCNHIQQLADKTRLGIPVTIGIDPWHAFSFNPLTGLPTKGFSEWPERLGFAALGDSREPS